MIALILFCFLPLTGLVLQLPSPLSALFSFAHTDRKRGMLYRHIADVVGISGIYVSSVILYKGLFSLMREP